nr:unnamed protein product [Callosobruchus analis]
MRYYKSSYSSSALTRSWT